MTRHHHTSITLPTGHAPYALTATPDGAIWMTLPTPGALARLDPTTTLTNRPGTGPRLHQPTGGPCRPMQLTATGTTVWYTRNDDRLGRLDDTGDQHLIDLPTGAAPYGICATPDDTVWFTAPGTNQVGHLTTDGHPRLIDLPPQKAYPAMLTATPDGTVWVALNAAAALAHIHPDHTIDVIPLPHDTTPAAPVGIAATTTGVWYTDIARGRIGHVTPDGTINDITLTDPTCRPHAVAADPDGGCWVTLWATTELAHITNDGTVTRHRLPGQEPHGLLLTDTHVWVAMENGILVAVDRTTTA